MASTIVGTPHYLSPEMCDNKPYGRKVGGWGCAGVRWLCGLGPSKPYGRKARKRGALGGSGRRGWAVWGFPGPSPPRGDTRHTHTHTH
jgi:hypothetical protein